jgi:Zn-dependent protease with chaperone function
MISAQSLYPATPLNVPLSVTNSSEGFKKEVKKVMSSIILFFVVYVILMLLSVALAIGCLYAGVFVMGNSGHTIGFIAGAGIISIGIMVFIFLIKFIFSVKKHDESGTVQVTEKEQPELFRFIRQLTTDTQTQFPKKIVLSPEVNACVYYNDSFWSMFFPVKKNLQIGLGLVNSLTVSEFKAVMAHEFGHFSQRSMKLGSFVYHVNKAIYNMLYENKGFSNFISKWGSLHIAIWIFVWLTIQLVQGIQFILQKMYGFINKNYMGLSREMEFHADAVAASVSGSNNLITALRKIEVSDICYESVIQKANEWLADNYRFENVYSNHDEVMIKYASTNDLPLQNATPVPDEAFFKNYQLHKVNIKNQWASHPPREEREDHLQQLNVDAVRDDQPAWAIFTDAGQLQKKLTEQLYRTVPDQQQKETLNAAAFKERYLHDIKTFSLPEDYNGFYDGRQVNEMNVERICSLPEEPGIEFNYLFSDEMTGLIKSLTGNEYDAVLLKAIVDKQIDTKTFDYDGEKMEKDAAPQLLEKLNNEITQQKEHLQKIDERILLFFYHTAKRQSAEAAATLREKYISYFTNRKKSEDFMAVGNRIINLMAPLFAGQSVQIEDAKNMARSLRAETETIKPMIRQWVSLGVFSNKKESEKKAADFLSADYHYFSENSFFDNELSTLHQLVDETAVGIGTHQLKSFKEILEYQLDVYKKVKGISGTVIDL